MQKTFVTILLLGSAVAGFAQGTVFFSNGGLNKVSIGWWWGPYAPVPTTPGLINYGLFYGIGATQPTTLTFLSTTLGVNSTVTAGVIASAADGTSLLTSVTIPGTQPNDANVWFQVKGWSASLGTDWATAQTTPDIYFGQTAIINAAGLGPPTGPGVPIWQTVAGTNPNKFPGGGFVLYASPEPSTITLFGLGVVAALVFRRGKYPSKQ